MHKVPRVGSLKGLEDVGAKERWRSRRDEEAGGCIRQQVANALWELSGRFEVGLWYEYVRVGVWSRQFDIFCGVVVDGVKLDQPYCRSAEECVEEILRDYKREVERLREPPEPALVVKIDPVEELLKEWPELGAYGVDWVRKWLDLASRTSPLSAPRRHSNLIFPMQGVSPSATATIDFARSS
jgi:hypothetical protein